MHPKAMEKKAAAQKIAAKVEDEVVVWWCAKSCDKKGSEGR